jgi:acyl dehydratase
VTRETVTLSEFEARRNGAPMCSQWHRIGQEDVDAFARLSGDDAYIHTDPVRAASTRFGGTIVHGLLTLALLPRMLWEATPVIAGTRMGVNYGFEKLRFIAPVRVGSRVRAAFMLAGLAQTKPGFHLLSFDVEVAIEGGHRPALAGRWLLGRWINAAAHGG